ncbi:expressed unknown protein [Seminavis robusta]|uniref:VWFD domain-containing protein n=1 Tax=Seminavis robusta TaxID=568900 RepID=A0A9N8F038_9STRA|nr:expressed unknown protein [Seminavis robusta]|eukprot:Sro2311_g322850.1 n/a (332) ;mRNA; r:11332-12770
MRFGKFWALLAVSSLLIQKTDAIVWKILDIKGLCYDNRSCIDPLLLYGGAVVSWCTCWRHRWSRGFEITLFGFPTGVCLPARRRLEESSQPKFMRELQTQTESCPQCQQCPLDDKSISCPPCENGMFGEPHIKKWSGEWIGDEETIEVFGFGQYFLKGVNGAELPGTIAGYNVTHTEEGKNNHAFTIDAGDGTLVILKTNKDIVSVKFKHGSRSIDHFEGSEGLMGTLETGDMLGRDGVTILKDPNEFGQEWQVRDDEPMIFQNADRSPQYPAKCLLPSPTASKGRRLGEEPISRADAERACENWDELSKDACIFDVMATGDLELALPGGY